MTRREYGIVVILVGLIVSALGLVFAVSTPVTSHWRAGFAAMVPLGLTGVWIGIIMLFGLIKPRNS